MARHLLILNPHAGGGRAEARARAMTEGLDRAEHEFQTALTEGPGHATVLARENAAAFDTIVAAGGDGTVNEVATGLYGAGEPRPALGILPFGTGNDVAHTLGLRDWETAARALLDGGEEWLDVAEVTLQREGSSRTSVSLLWVGIGFPAEVILKTTERVKRTLGKHSYLYSTIRCALSHRCPTMRITTDGQTREGKYAMCAVANIAWTGGHTMHIAPGARHDDGRLDLVLLREATALRLLSKLSCLGKGTHIHLPDVEFFPGHDVRVESSPPCGVNIDGEYAGSTPVHVRVRPGALHVKVAR
jgi:diacylglycerol kinase (ATP)